MVKRLKSMFAVMVLSIIVIMVVPASAATIKIDFEDLNGGDFIGTHYAGLTFDSGAQIFHKPDYIYEDYPPHSGNNVFVENFTTVDNRNTTINFASPVSRVGIWYTSATEGNIDAYNSTGTLVNTSSGGANLKSNTYLEVSGSNITYVILHDTGEYITYDDLEYDTSEKPTPSPTHTPKPTPIPEFSMVAFPAISIIGLITLLNHRMQKK